ncbi:hypothetical protein SRABI27_04673 [Pedobacter sp. Bi27]|uniref:O-antigen polymerase n=1 Tax=unclassified Pedobacter TaxID=2628915 RepID=UPI001DA9DA5A|nr:MULTISPECIES: O-antigen polymerase [unclassified Pedobacter]CAH0198843.1 hypothetical protein SRABI36_01943 [Pedobacter sp. Bi36]CAH0254435.1 hypothetical protein SRABI126_03037 [Pedobacter sp. Bi126]CAH0308457.1 hypothetical protein SRABI27_04673 [Pedobacter sp. Bi27]
MNTKIITLFKPILIFIVVWLLVFFLYSMRLSELIWFEASAGFKFFFIATFSFCLGYFFVFLLRGRVVEKPFVYTDSTIKNIEKRIIPFFKFWIFFTIIEVIFSKGVPLLWIIQGSEKTYFDFGLPSLHGLLNALQTSLGIISFFLYIKTGKKKYLYICLFTFIWQIVVISRQLIVTQIIEIFYIYFIFSKSQLKLVRNLSFFGLFFIILFGVVGDLRTGQDKFYELAMPSQNWISWLPSGFLWVYIYLATPFNNLLFNFSVPITNYDPSFPNTTSLLLPSLIRNFFYGDNTVSNTSGALISEAFNVSSAFTSPYLDMGYYGIAIFSFTIGIISFLAWWSKGNKRVLFRAVIAQCLILSIFYNHFFYLPIIFQLFWISLIVKDEKL